MWIGKRNSDAIKKIDLHSSKSKDELLKDFAETVTELTRTGMKSITEAELIDYINICPDEEE